MNFSLRGASDQEMGSNVIINLCSTPTYRLRKVPYKYWSLRILIRRVKSSVKGKSVHVILLELSRYSGNRNKIGRVTFLYPIYFAVSLLAWT